MRYYLSNMQLSDPWSGTCSPPADPWQITSRPPITSGASGLSNIGDAWTSQRTQSPSVASGSSTEGWLQNRSTPTTGINGNTTTVPDPWLPKGVGAEKSETVPEDPWQPKTNQKLAASSVVDPWAPVANNLEVRKIL